MTWTITVGKEPKAVILQDLTIYPDGLGGIIYNGKALPPGPHKVTKDSIIEYRALAENIGGEGTIWLRLLVDGQEVDRSEDSKIAGIAGTITANADMTIKFEAGHNTTSDDDWGIWNITVTEPVPPTPPTEEFNWLYALPIIGVLLLALKKRRR